MDSLFDILIGDELLVCGCFYLDQSQIDMCIATIA